MTVTPRTPWTAESYSPLVTASGAVKLADSGVAPLIAAARGYSTVTDTVSAKALANRSTVNTGHMTLARTLVRLVDDGEEDLLVIPWYRASGVAEQGTAVKSRTTQYRPSRPDTDLESGKVMKYMFMPGEGTTMDFHPSTPHEWITSSSKILMTEGALKGDSALTGQLRQHGITDEELALPDDLATARAYLETLMLRVPAKSRIPIISFASVTTWAGQPDWYALKLNDRKVFVAFDGDTGTNWNVWNQAKKLFDFVESKKATPGFVNFASPDAELAKLNAGVPAEEKLGIDDYLAQVGDWDSVLGLVDLALPPEPAKKDADQYTVGMWRVSPQHDNMVEEFAQEVGFDGSKMPAQWTKRVSIGGRIVSAESRRRPSREEISTGSIIAELNAELSHSTCTIEVVWRDINTDERKVAAVTGPATLLAYAPADWVRQGATIPNALLLHPEWPPRKGPEWMSAIKAHRSDETEEKNGWDTMGWVPTDGGHPAFIVGANVLGRNEADEVKTVAGVTDKVLGGSSSFGVIDTYREPGMTLDLWKAQVRDDIRAVVSTFIDGDVWTDRSAAVAAVAAMLRPTIPVPISVTLYIYGPPRAGKTFTGAFILSGWQPKPGIWSVRNLPGAAGDTLPSIEYSIARTPIWIADDLAPSVDKRKAEQQEGQVGDLIRSVHNGSARRKMDVRTGMQQGQAEPTALFIITAENEPQTPSVRERVVAINTPNGAFGDEAAIAALQHLCDVDGAPARLTAAMIRYWTFDNNQFGDSWPEKTAAIRQEIMDIAAQAEDVLQHELGVSSGEAARHARIAAELAVSFEVLKALASWVGMPDDDPILKHLEFEDGSYPYDLFRMAGRTVTRQRESTPGRMLVQTLSKLMLGLKAHVENPNSPGSPPAEANPTVDGDQAASKAAFINRTLGWVPDVNGAWVPKGVAIGNYGVTSKGEHIVLFEAVNAFREAQRNYPDRILPGQNATVGWASVWSEGLCASQSYKKRADSNTVAARVTDSRSLTAFSAVPRLYGVPVLLEAVINPTFNMDDDDQTEDRDEVK